MSKSTKTLTVIVIGLVAVFAKSVDVTFAGQQTGPKTPALIIPSVYGRDLFEFYCSSCHGRNGRGGGPAVSALRVAPPDLTTIAARNNSVYPKTRVEAFVTGERDMPTAHGSREMPVWGPIFSALDPNDGMNRVRIANIVEYVASLQAK